MADAQQYRPKSRMLPKGVFRPDLPKPVALMVVTIDGVPEWLMMAEGGSEKDVADFKKLKASYAELVGEDNGHYVAGTVHVCEVQDDGVVQVGNGVLAWEDGVRTLTRVPTPDDEDAPKTGNGNGNGRTTRPKPSTAKKPVAAKATTTRKKPTAKKATAKKTTSAKRPVRRSKPKPRKR